MVKRDPLITLVRAVIIYNKYILDNMQIAQFLQEKTQYCRKSLKHVILRLLVLLC